MALSMIEIQNYFLILQFGNKGRLPPLFYKIQSGWDSASMTKKPNPVSDFGFAHKFPVKPEVIGFQLLKDQSSTFKGQTRRKSSPVSSPEPKKICFGYVLPV